MLAMVSSVLDWVDAIVPDNAAVLELAFGLVVASGVVLLTLLLPIMSFVRAQQARRIASELRERVASLEAEVAQLRFEGSTNVARDVVPAVASAPITPPV